MADHESKQRNDTDRATKAMGGKASVDVIIVGQGLAGSCLAWSLHWSGRRVLLIDRNEAVTASKIAAGLMTPITGQRMALMPGYERLLRAATSFYRRVEQEMGIELLTLEPAKRYFRNDSEEQEYRLKEKELKEFSEVLRDRTGEMIGFSMPKAGRLHTARFLQATREYFEKRGESVTAEIDVRADIEVGQHTVKLPRFETTGSAVVFCQGWQSERNPRFADQPDGPSKGEILKVKLNNYKEKQVVHKGIWVVPMEGREAPGEYQIGATYDRKNLNSQPTAQGREALLKALKEITDETPEVINHVAGVRAGTKRRRPILGRNAETDRVFIVNGLGSRGTLYAPLAAKTLTDIIQGGAVDQELETVLDFTEGLGAKNERRVSKRKSLTLMAQTAIRRAVRPGDQVIDATAGNGHDTLMLAEAVGNTGRVIAIDIQAEALEQTKRRLASSGRNVELRQGNHGEELKALRDEGFEAKAIMFNLGYLPGSDKSIVTNKSTTTSAISTAIELLSPAGLLTVIAYRGHVGGEEEAVAVKHELRQLPERKYELSEIVSDPNKPVSPVLYLIKRKR